MKKPSKYIIRYYTKKGTEKATYWEEFVSLDRFGQDEDMKKEFDRLTGQIERGVLSYNFTQIDRVKIEKVVLKNLLDSI